VWRLGVPELSLILGRPTVGWGIWGDGDTANDQSKNRTARALVGGWGAERLT